MENTVRACIYCPAFLSYFYIMYAPLGYFRSLESIGPYEIETPIVLMLMCSVMVCIQYMSDNAEIYAFLAGQGLDGKKLLLFII